MQTVPVLITDTARTGSPDPGVPRDIVVTASTTELPGARCLLLTCPGLRRRDGTSVTLVGLRGDRSHRAFGLPAAACRRAGSRITTQSEVVATIPAVRRSRSARATNSRTDP